MLGREEPVALPQTGSLCRHSSPALSPTLGENLKVPFCSELTNGDGYLQTRSAWAFFPPLPSSHSLAQRSSRVVAPVARPESGIQSRRQAGSTWPSHGNAQAQSTNSPPKTTSGALLGRSLTVKDRPWRKERNGTNRKSQGLQKGN